MDANAIRKQSEAAYGQWCVQWREQAKVNGQFKMKSLEDLEMVGIGRAVLCVANGYTFEQNIETIKKYKDQVDIFCCDKTLGHLLENGIEPTYCMVCDANVNYEKYLKKWEGKLQNTILLMNVCANPEWAIKGNWKEMYFFVNKDILGSEKEFAALSGCQNFIPAGTNVSNAMVVMLTQCDNSGKRNFFGYDKILLIGFDYSWQVGGKYYAFDEDGQGKAKYMKHLYCVLNDGSYGYTSGNLIFSAQWLEKYIKTFDLPVVQCDKRVLLNGVRMGRLEEQMQYQFQPGDSKMVREKLRNLRRLYAEIEQEKAILGKTSEAHFFSFLGTV